MAVSGGPDSLGLLLLAADAQVPCAVATVDHGLRPESADEAATVAALCASHGLDHTTLRIDLPSGTAVQERARSARYAALGDWVSASGLAAVVTGHHADDQAETLLMRLNRGAGVRGLAAMRLVSVVPDRPQMPLLRPLLSWRRSDLARVVTASGIIPVKDPSNQDMRFERARLRARLAEAPWLDCGALAASTIHLGEADAALEWAAARAFASAIWTGPILEWSPGDTPRVVTLRILERILGEFGCAAPRGSALARWHDELAAGRNAMLANVLAEGRKAAWRFSAAPSRRKR